MKNSSKVKNSRQFLNNTKIYKLNYDEVKLTQSNKIKQKVYIVYKN